MIKIIQTINEEKSEPIYSFKLASETIASHSADPTRIVSRPYGPEDLLPQARDYQIIAKYLLEPFEYRESIQVLDSSGKQLCYIERL